MLNKIAPLAAVLILCMQSVALAAPLGESAEMNIGSTYGGTLYDAIVSPVCGDPYVTGTEQCDGSNLNFQTCLTLGFVGGTLSCNADCTLNTALCTSAPSGGSTPSAPSGESTSYVSSSSSVAPVPKCPVCPASGAWSECTDGRMTRPVYYCDASTNYTCVLRTDTKYCIGDDGSKDASMAISDAEAVIEQARSEGKDVTLADSLISQAREAFDSKDYESTIVLATQAMESAQNATVPIVIEDFVWLLIVAACAGAMIFVVVMPNIIYKELEHSDMITYKHIGKKVMFRGYLDPVKRYADRTAYRIAHETKPYATYGKLLAIGHEIKAVPDVKYGIYGKIHKLADGGLYMKIEKIKPFLSS